MMSSPEDEFLLKWHDHHQSFFLLVEELVLRDQLTDVTLACGAPDTDQQLLSAHSLMLSVCSPYFRALLADNRASGREKHHIVHLGGVSGRHMQQLLVYMYRGEISISQEDLGPLIETAKCLQIKGLAMAQTNVSIPAPPESPSPPRKRTFSQVSPGLESPPPAAAAHSSSAPPPAPAPAPQLSPKSKKTKTKPRPPSPSVSEPSVASSQDVRDEPPTFVKGEIVTEERPEIGEIKDFLPDMSDPFFNHKGSVLGNQNSSSVTAETRTYLSKLIWLGNGGRRPQYGNPDTKPLWWPQHILPWEEMKKMGGRKSVELSNINYTEILKQCLATGYEYFGYDPATYFNTDHDQDASLQQECSYVIDDGGGAVADDDCGSSCGDPPEQPLEIDLDHVAKEEKETSLKSVRRTSDQKQILCK